MIVLGITGEIGSGKDTFSAHLIKIAKDKKILRIRFSDILKETLELWSIPLTRHNLQYLAVIMDKQYGKGTLTNALRQKIVREKAEIVIIEGVRWQTDIPLIRSFAQNKLIYITSDQKTRFKRIKKRSEKVGEKNLTFERFLIEDKAPTEIHISKLGKKADIKFENNETISDFKKKIKSFYKSLKI